MASWESDHTFSLHEIAPNQHTLAEDISSSNSSTIDELIDEIEGRALDDTGPQTLSESLGRVDGHRTSAIVNHDARKFCGSRNDPIVIDGHGSDEARPSHLTSTERENLKRARPHIRKRKAEYEIRWNYAECLSHASYALESTWNEALLYWIKIREIVKHYKGLDRDFDEFFTSFKSKMISVLAEEDEVGICPNHVANLQKIWEDVLEKLRELGYLQYPYEVQESQKFSIKLGELVERAAISHCLSVYPQLVGAFEQANDDDNEPCIAKRHCGA